MARAETERSGRGPVSRPRHLDETDTVFPHHYTFQDGYMYPGDAPGLGIDIDETRVKVSLNGKEEFAPTDLKAVPEAALA